MDLQTHTRKQIQMHMTAKVTAEKLAVKTKNLKFFATHSSYDVSYFTTLDVEPITVERFVDGEFTNYVNNNGNPCLKVFGKSSIIEPLMKHATKSFCWLICNRQIINYAIQRSQIWKH